MTTGNFILGTFLVMPPLDSMSTAPFTPGTMIPIHSLLNPAAQDLQSSSSWTTVNLGTLPIELRLKVWACAIEPRLVLFSDLVQDQSAYPLPAVAQLNSEARAETRRGYESIGHGSYFDFDKDIFVCDHNVSDKSRDEYLEGLAPRIKRLAYWDCYPDDGRVERPHHYSIYLSACYRQRNFGRIEFDRFWFPNLEDMWIVKVGEIDPAWMIQVDWKSSYQARLKALAKQFRYWVKDSIIEMAPLDLNDAEVHAVVYDGRCGAKNCHELNEGRNMMVSKIQFMDGEYTAPNDGNDWVRIKAWNVDEENEPGNRTCENRMRWVLVERVLTFDLRFDVWNEMGLQRTKEVR